MQYNYDDIMMINFEGISIIHHNEILPSHDSRVVSVKDIDECERETDQCNHLCENNVGSYTCSCHSGFELMNDFHCEGKSYC